MRLKTLFLAALLTAGLRPCIADRIVLAPQAETPYPDSLQSEYLITPYRHNGSLLFLRYSTSQTIEFEIERQALSPDSKSRYALNIEYPLTIDYGALPAISVGIRDLLGTGTEHIAPYLAVSKDIGISERQEHYIRQFRLTAGYGAGSMDGVFLGGSLTLGRDLMLTAELYRDRPNFGIGFEAARGLQIRADSLDGTVFFGASLHLIR